MGLGKTTGEVTEIDMGKWTVKLRAGRFGNGRAKSRARANVFPSVGRAFR